MPQTCFLASISCRCIPECHAKVVAALAVVGDTAAAPVFGDEM